jgi:hypothetical protein
MDTTYLTIYKDKNGEMDFGVHGPLMDLSLEDMNKFRAMAVVALGSAEDIWRRQLDRKNPPAQTAQRNQ